MKKNYYLGIDMAKSAMSYQLENERAEVLAKGYVRATLKAMHRFCELMEAKGSTAKQTVVLIEATGTWPLPWCEHLSGRGYQVLAVNPLVSKRLYTPGNVIRAIPRPMRWTPRFCVRWLVAKGSS